MRSVPYGMGLNKGHGASSRHAASCRVGGDVMQGAGQGA